MPSIKDHRYINQPKFVAMVPSSRQRSLPCVIAGRQHYRQCGRQRAGKAAVCNQVTCRQGAFDVAGNVTGNTKLARPAARLVARPATRLVTRPAAQLARQLENQRSITRRRMRDKPKGCAHSKRQPDQSPRVPLCGCSSRTSLWMLLSHLSGDVPRVVRCGA